MGYGFEKGIYENALLMEFKNLKLDYEHKRQIEIHYEGFEMGKFESDFVVKNSVVVQIQTDDGFNPTKEQQLSSVLKSSVYEVGLLLNFGLTPEHKTENIY